MNFFVSMYIFLHNMHKTFQNRFVQVNFNLAKQNSSSAQVYLQEKIFQNLNADLKTSFRSWTYHSILPTKISQEDN